MTKVYGIHVVELREGITPEFFEKFVTEQFLPALPLDKTPGVRASLLKGERGARIHQYVFLFEFDNIDTRNRYFPEPLRISQELAELIAPLRDVATVWDRASQRVKTDYLVIATNPPAKPRV
jgi:hypothetical protein